MANNGRQIPSLNAADIGQRYNQKEIVWIGQGAYGAVFSAYDETRRQKVAIKKIQKSNVIHLQRTFRELYILKRLRHRNIVELTDLFCVPAGRSWNTLYLVLNFMPTDLHNLIQRGRDQLTPAHVKWLTYSLLCGVRYIHSAGVIHRDIKPQNILVDEICALKICDFGLARVADAVHIENGELTQYVATRWWRAPEVILNPGRYTKAMDIWSVGCILAEMLTGRALFPGRDTLQQLTVIFSVIGTPSSEAFDAAQTGPAARTYAQGLARMSQRPWSAVIGNQEANVYDLLDNLLAFVPTQRLTAETALQHSYLAEQRGIGGDESVRNEPITRDMEMVNVAVAGLEGMIAEEVQNFV